jgi:hypothetical protein
MQLNLGSFTNIRQWTLDIEGLRLTMLNVDAASFVQSNCMGAGFILRNNRGLILLAGCRRFTHVTDPELAEAIAMRIAAEFDHGSTLDSSAGPFHFTHLITKRLSSENYMLWRAQIPPLLSSRHLERFIDGTSPCPPKLVSAVTSTSVWSRPQSLPLGRARPGDLIRHPVLPHRGDCRICALCRIIV